MVTSEQSQRNNNIQYHTTQSLRMERNTTLPYEQPLVDVSGIARTDGKHDVIIQKKKRT